MSASTFVLSSLGGFLSSPPKNLSHSIWSCRIDLSMTSTSSSMGTLGLAAHEDPEEGQPEFVGVGSFLPVDQHLRTRALAHEVVEIAEYAGGAGLEGRVVGRPVRAGDLAVGGRAPGQFHRPRVALPGEGLEGDPHSVGAGTAAGVEDVPPLPRGGGEIRFLLRGVPRQTLPRNPS